MVGSRGKGSKSKPKGIQSGPVEPVPLKSSLDESADVASDGEDGKNDISNRRVIPLEEQMDEIISRSASDGNEEKGQNAVNDSEKNILTEINVERTEDVLSLEGTNDVKEVSDGDDEAPNVSDEDNEERTDQEKPEEDEAPSKELDNNDASNGTTENMTDNMENHKEPNMLDADKPVGTPPDREEEHMKENASITDDVNEITEKVNRPKKKVIKKRLVRKKLVRKIPQPSDENNASDEVCKVDASEHVNEEKASNVDAASVEECKEDNNEHVDNEEKADVKASLKVNKKRNKIRKKKAPQGHSGAVTVKDAQKLHSENDELASKEHIGISEPDVKNEEVEKSGDRASPLKGNRKKKMAKKDSREVVPKDVDKPKPSKEGKSSKRIDSMGMIFMCSSETKKDCYRYKVLGLPAGKKDMVLKIYKGMRLFLFDVDLRMMYGIYKAAAPGGYNIEPRAFKSQFPSQVRFVVLEDCVPLAEEKFRKVLKDNYYTKNKFNFQLNSEQVKNLCKLFHETSKKAESIKTASGIRRAPATGLSAKAASRTRRAAVATSSSAKAARASLRAAATSSSAHRDRKRKRAEDDRRGADRLLERERTRRIAQEEIRRAPMVIADRYYERPVYERESYLAPVAPPATLYQPLPPHSPPRTATYTFDRAPEVDDPYRRNLFIERRDLVPSSRESRLAIERDHYDPYVSYIEAAQVYSGSAYSTGTRREQHDYTTASDGRYGSAYSTSTRREQHDYTTASDGRYADYYRAVDYRPPQPLYRRY